MKSNTQELSLVPVEEQPYPLPEDWKWVRLGDVVSLYNGDRGKNYPSKKDYVSSGPAFVNAGAIEFGRINFSNVNFITEEKFNSLRAGKINNNDVLYCLRGSIGKTALIDFDSKAAISSSLCILRGHSCIVQNYIFYLMQSETIIRQQIAVDNGSAQPNLSAQNTLQYKIPLPPLDEQERIVARIESLFAKLDEAKEKAEAVLDTFEKRKAAILHKAFTGEFSKSSAEFSTWEEKTAQELFTYVTSGSRGWAKYYSDSGAVFIRMGNLDHGTIELDLSDIQHVQLPNKAEGQRSRLQKNDILISITADVGMVGLVRDDSFEGYINQHVALARPSSKEDAEFIAWYLVSDVGFAQMRKKQRGATKVGLGLDDIRTLQLKMPPLEEQQRITRILDSLLEKEQQSKEAAETVLEQIDLMKKAILAKAFRGELGN